MRYDKNLWEGGELAVSMARTLEVDSVGLVLGADKAPEGAPQIRQQDIFVEVARGARLSEIREHWKDLLGRAAEPNVFLDPLVIQAAAQSYPDSDCGALVAWLPTNDQLTLGGILGFSIGVPPRSVTPMRVLRVPGFIHGYAGTPVIDRACLEPVLAAMVTKIAADQSLPNIVAFNAMANDGPTMLALQRVLALRGNAPRIIDQTERPRLESRLQAKEYWENALSSSSRKKLRQHRRRLSEKGALSSVLLSEPEAVCRALEHFLKLEASGWKGREQTAVTCNEADAKFARTAIEALAKQGRVSIHALYLDGQPVSMQIVLRAGTAAFTWKTAYDENFQDFSPGMLLLEDYTATFLNDPSIRWVNSCAYDGNSFMSVWLERESIADHWVDVRMGRSLSFEVQWLLHKGYSDLRRVAKNISSKRRRASKR